MSLFRARRTARLLAFFFQLEQMPVALRHARLSGNRNAFVDRQSLQVSMLLVERSAYDREQSTATRFGTDDMNVHASLAHVRTYNGTAAVTIEDHAGAPAPLR